MLNCDNYIAILKPFNGVQTNDSLYIELFEWNRNTWNF